MLRSGIEGNDTDGRDGIVGTISLAVFVILSILLVGLSSAPAAVALAINATATRNVLIL
jgi:hypothetical protein